MEVDQAALAFDFRRGVVRRDLGKSFARRPGIYLHERLAELQRAGISSLLINGNNLGYWGNQYVINQRRLVWKKRGAIFDDSHLDQYARAIPHTFFCADRGAFERQDTDVFAIQRISFNSDKNIEDSGIWVAPSSATSLPRAGVSGLPLVSGGRAIWQAHVADAWDPHLIFADGARIVDRSRSQLLRDFESSALAPTGLARHAMTIVGVDRRGRAVLVVAERSRRSLGIHVEEAAELARALGVCDALVLGAAGDAQVGSTDEGLFVEPYVADHVAPFARPVPDALRSSTDVKGTRTVSARPVPCLVRFDLRTKGDDPVTAQIDLRTAVLSANLMSQLR